MLAGYVSDERYVALGDVLIEFERDGESVAVARSSARGAIRADLTPGDYQVTLVKDGYGSKTVRAHLDDTTPYQFRLLSDRLAGYMWPKWVRAGERSEFRVHSPEPYRLSLWRYGYKKELVRPIGWFDEHGPRAVMQVTPDGDYTQTGIRWNTQGYGSPHHTQFLAGPARSGLYYLHAEGESGAFFAFPWVVAPAQPSAPIAVLASTNTWNAYNNFGGRSNYINATGLPERPVVNARLDMVRYQQAGEYSEWHRPDDEYLPLSFERPEPCNSLPAGAQVTDSLPGRQQCHLAPAEWRLLGWLEREGYAYDFYAEAQLHDGTLDLDAYKVVILSTHPEYWSRQMYERLKAWVFERGGRLMYLGGNGLNCEVEFLDVTTLRFKSFQPRSAGFASDAESRFGRTVESEANLLGVVYTEAGIMTAAPYAVRNAAHWVFTGTGLRDGDLFGQHSLHERIPGGASGHETDKMSASSPANTILLAQGANPEDGGAHMVLHEPAGGGAVFSVGSITYPATLLVDEQISRVTANVLSRFLQD
jgi:N,N-dimethylformamidase